MSVNYRLQGRNNVILSVVFVLASLLTFASTASAQGARYDGTTQARSGFPAPSVSIAVCTQPAVTTTTPCSALATLYTNATLAVQCSGVNLGPNIPGSACSNPMLADGLGNFHFYAAPGTYTLQFYGSGITTYSQYDMTLPGSVANGGAISPSNINNILVVDGVKYATCAAAITAAGSVNKVIIIVPSTYSGAECPVVTNINGESESITTANITIWDFRGGAVGHIGADWNSSSQDAANTIQSRLSIYNYNSAITSNFTTSAILGTNHITGTYPSGSVAGITAEVDTTGALASNGNGILQGINGETHVRSTGQTLAFVAGVEGGGGFDRNTSTTNVTTWCAVCGDTLTNNASSSTLQDAYSFRAGTQTIGTRNNYAFAAPSGGNWGFSDNTGIDIFNGSTGQKLLRFGIDTQGTGGINLYAQASPSIAPVFHYIADPTGAIHFNFMTAAQANLSNCFELTPSTAVGGTTFTNPALTACTTTGGAGNSTVNIPGSLTVAGVPVAGSGFTGVNVTPVTVNTSTTADQNLMAITITASALNSASRTLLVQLAGVYSTPAGSTAVLTHKLKLCTVSGCGSGTVLTLATWVTAALGAIQVTNDPYNAVLNASTQTTGASAAFEAHGNLTIDLSALTTAAEAIYADNNTATVGTIDSTAQLFLQHSIAFSAASASNSATDRQMIADTID